MTKDDKLLLALVEDKLRQCEDNYMPVATDFLDLHQRSIVENALKDLKPQCKVEFYGGYDDAERCVCCFVPDYTDAEQTAQLAVVRVKALPGGKELTHRDYLGSLLGLGIKREKTGDIIVYQGGADLVVVSDLTDFISLNYDKVGRTLITVEVLPISQIRVVQHDFKEKEDTVASLRMDNIVSSAFGVSRSKASEAIKRGIVFVNNVECFKVDKEAHIGDKIVFRGKGKAYLVESGGLSRKGRIYVKFKVFG